TPSKPCSANRRVATLIRRARVSPAFSSRGAGSAVPSSRRLAALLARTISSIDPQIRSGHERRLLAGQIYRRLGDLGRLAKAAERHAAGELFLQRLTRAVFDQEAFGHD